MNEHLPAAVYIPFCKDSIRNYVVLNIIAGETRVFSTKERAPFYICLEIYRPEEDREQTKQVEGSSLSESNMDMEVKLDTPSDKKVSLEL